MTNNPEWDGDGEDVSLIPDINEPGPSGISGYSGSGISGYSTYNPSFTMQYDDSLSATTSWTTTAGMGISAGIDINNERIVISVPRIVFSPQPNNPFSAPIDWNMTGLTWMQTINLALNIMLAPFLCILSKLRNRSIGIG